MSDHKKRIKELETEGTGLLEKRQQAVTAVNQIDVRVSEIRGAIAELTKLDKPVSDKPEEPKA